MNNEAVHLHINACIQCLRVAMTYYAQQHYTMHIIFSFVKHTAIQGIYLSMLSSYLYSVLCVYIIMEHCRNLTRA